MILGETAFCPNKHQRIATLLHSSRNSTNIHNPQIYCVNRYLFMFGGSQVQMPYHASMNSVLNFRPWCRKLLEVNVALSRHGRIMDILVQGISVRSAEIGEARLFLVVRKFVLWVAGSVRVDDAFFGFLQKIFV